MPNQFLTADMVLREMAMIMKRKKLKKHKVTLEDIFNALAALSIDLAGVKDALERGNAQVESRAAPQRIEEGASSKTGEAGT